MAKITELYKLIKQREKQIDQLMEESLSKNNNIKIVEYYKDIMEAKITILQIRYDRISKILKPL